MNEPTQLVATTALAMIIGYVGYFGVTEAGRWRRQRETNRSWELRVGGIDNNCISIRGEIDGVYDVMKLQQQNIASMTELMKAVTQRLLTLEQRQAETECRVQALAEAAVTNGCGH